MNKIKERKIFVYLILLVLLFLLLLYFKELRFRYYIWHKIENPYLKDLNISMDWKLSSVEKIYGKPVSVKEIYDTSYIMDYGRFSVLVDKSVYWNHNGSEGDARFYSLIFTDPNYRFSNNKPSIGSTKGYAMQYYQDKLMIKDIPPENNEFGYVFDSGQCIYFTVNNEDVIIKIQITSGLA